MMEDLEVGGEIVNRNGTFGDLFFGRSPSLRIILEKQFTNWIRFGLCG